MGSGSGSPSSKAVISGSVGCVRAAGVGLVDVVVGPAGADLAVVREKSGR